MSDIIEVFDPGNGELIGSVANASRDDVVKLTCSSIRVYEFPCKLDTELPEVMIEVNHMKLGPTFGSEIT